MKNVPTSQKKPRLPHEGCSVDGADVRASDGQLQLVGSHCQQCDARIFPSNVLCPFCLSEDVKPLPLSNIGSLYSFTVIHAAPAMWEVPYGIAYVDLPEKVRVFGKLAHADGTQWKLDQKVQLRVARAAGSDEQNPQYQYFFDAA